ncbi:MAG: conjugative transposon protein TraK [Flavisolibacter sp.]
MFQQAKNMDTAFRQVRMFTLVVMLTSFSLAVFISYKSYQLASWSSEHIYVLAGGKALEAFASLRNENIPVEARDHVRMFHNYFFTLDPDEKVIRQNMENALYLADGSAKKVYETLKENNYYAGIISGNISQKISVDSIWVDMDRSPIYFKCRATITIIRTSTITTRNLVTEGYLRSVNRSDNNPHGFIIERWNTLENRDIKSEAR